ncbi:GH92 family glycosyl hydrolase [candidate division KSB1 bacterium]|nr:GH92 family glycosyl hydrolase [candidate division KSB1 bacterium]
MPIKFLILIFMGLLFLHCCENVPGESFDPLDHVDPLIGGANRGVSAGAATSWGMVTMTPQFVADRTSAHNGDSEQYENSDEYIYGFSHTAVADPECPPSSILIMPVFGERRWRANERRYHYSLEAASAGYYKVTLAEDRIFADFTTTPRTALSRFRFQNGWAHIVLDLSQDPFGHGWVRITAPNEIVGFVEQSQLIDPGRRRLCFVAQFDRTAMGGGVFDGERLLPESVDEVTGKEVGAVFSFRTLDGNAIQVKVGISYVSIDNARLNLQTEQPSFSFALVRQNARASWEKELAKIRITGGSAEHATLFYTALYRSLLQPHIINDVNDEYPLMSDDDAVGTVKGMDRYSGFALWDTYRTLHPLLATLYPARQLDMIHSMIGMAMESGHLPNSELPAGAGPAVIVIADTYSRGLHNFDVDRAYEIMRQHAQVEESDITRHPALAQYDELGYIPYEPEPEQQLTSHARAAEQALASVAATLEYALADWTMAQMAKALGKTGDADFFNKRSQNYRHLYDVDSGFFRARLTDGAWLEPFDPSVGLYRSAQLPADGARRHASAWHGAFFVPHDMPGFIDLHGVDQFITRLQSIFANDYFDPGMAQDMACPFLFNYVEGEEWRTQKTVREVIARHFSTSHDGLPLQNNAGALSAWLVWAMLGLYPDCPASTVYQIATPFFDRIEIDLDSDRHPGASFIIETSKPSDEDIYIKSMRLNGAKLGSTLSHADLVKGGTLRIIARKNR